MSRLERVFCDCKTHKGKSELPEDGWVELRLNTPDATKGYSFHQEDWCYKCVERYIGAIKVREDDDEETDDLASGQDDDR